MQERAAQAMQNTQLLTLSTNQLWDAQTTIDNLCNQLSQVERNCNLAKWHRDWLELHLDMIIQMSQGHGSHGVRVFRQETPT
jgi:hypothetical protein